MYVARDSYAISILFYSLLVDIIDGTENWCEVTHSYIMIIAYMSIIDLDIDD